jgi:antitoxin HicB
MQYLARFQPDGDAILVTFPSVPEAITGGATDEEALTNAIDALEVALLTYAAEGRAIPPDDVGPKSGGRYRRIIVPATTSAKLAFITAFRESGLTRVALATKLGKSENEVRRMLDPYHHTKLGAIEAGLNALGKRIVLSVEKAA